MKRFGGLASFVGEGGFSGLLGGVLKGDTSLLSLSTSCIGASEDDLGGGSTGGGLLMILGLPARLTGGGTCGVEALCRSNAPLLRDSTVGLAAWEETRLGFVSRGIAGVPFRLDILNDLAPFETVGLCDEVSSEVWKEVREGSGEWICVPGE